MRFLAVQKIPVIPLNDYLAYRNKKGKLPPRSVVITIDDGYKTAKSIAWPILRKYGFPFTLYVYPHSISRIPTALTWKDLQEMSAAGVDVQSHTFTHPLLTHPAKPMNKNDYVAWLDQEMQESKSRIEKHLGKPVTSVAYPYGGYDELVVERVRLAGYQLGLSCIDADVTKTSDAIALGRKLIFHDTSPKAFVQLFQAPPMEVAPVSPRGGERVSGDVEKIDAKVLDLKSILPETAQIRVDKLGGKWIPVAIDPKTGQLSLKLPPHARQGYYSVKVRAQDRTIPALKRSASWQFIITKNASKK